MPLKSPHRVISTRRRWSKAIANLLAPKSSYGRLDEVQLSDEGLGFDRFGMEVESTQLAVSIYQRLFEQYFIVKSVGTENIPDRSPFIVTPNRMAPMPVDVLLISADILKNKLDQPKLLRPMLHPWLAEVPFINQLLTKTGAVWATPKNMHTALELGEPLLVFPQGRRSTLERLSGRREQLRAVSSRVIELGLRHRVPIIPVALNCTGSPRSRGTTTDSCSRHVTIIYGEPFLAHEQVIDSDPSPAQLRALADRLQNKVQQLIESAREAP